jgi:GntP family gluconate:H+ symporter
MPPLLVLALSMALVIGLIVWLRLHAFLALLIGAVVVGLATPAIPLTSTAQAVATEFGVVCGRIGIIIALASFIGIGLQQSGGAARIGAAFLALTGPRRAHLSMWASGYVLSVPVFFDTVFYLLQPLARAMHARARQGYTLYLMGIMAGGAATHVFVPPTPGPLAAASQLGVDLGLMIILGATVGLVGSLAGVLYSQFAARRWPDSAARTRALIEQASEETAGPAAEPMPSLGLALVPILLPVFLISGFTATTALKVQGPIVGWFGFLGDPNVALFLAAVVTMYLLWSVRGFSREQVAQVAEDAFASAGTIILITAAGGAYGGMLTKAGVGASLAASAQAFGLPLLLLAFLLASLLKFAQGSSTVAIITTASVLQATYTAGVPGLPHPVYAALAAAGGSLVGSWMNDSGFWVIAKMGGLTNAETVRLWSMTAAIVGTTGFLAAVLLQFVLPLR